MKFNIRKSLSAIFRLGLGLALSAVVFEASLQVIESTPLGKVLPAIEPQLGKPDKDIGYAFVPGMKALWTRENRAFVTINKLGLRDEDVALTKPAGSYRVALSGDSIVEALQVENNRVFENIAERELRATGHPVEIVNFAMSGNGPLRQLVRLEKFASPLQPDMFVMLMAAGDFLTGELSNDSGNPGYRITPQGTVERSYGFHERFSQRYADTVLGKTFLFLIHHSALFRLFYEKKNYAPAKLLGLTSASRMATKPEKDDCLHNKISDLYALWVKKQPADKWLITEHFLNEASAYAQNRPLLIGLYLPLLPDSCTRENEQRKNVTDGIKQILGDKGIGFIDWNKEVEKILPAGEKLSDLNGFGINFGNGHLNYHGHEIYARVLLSAILENTNQE